MQLANPACADALLELAKPPFRVRKRETPTLELVESGRLLDGGADGT